MSGDAPKMWRDAIDNGEAVALQALRSLHASPAPTDAALHKLAPSLFLLRELHRTWHTAAPGSAVVCTERDLYYRAPQLFGSCGQRGMHAATARLAGWLSRAAADTAPPVDPLLSRAWLAKMRKAPLSADSPDGYTREGLGVVAVAKAHVVGRLVITHDGGGAASPPSACASRAVSVWDLGALAGVPLSWSLVGPPHVRFAFAAVTPPSCAMTALTSAAPALSALERCLHDALHNAIVAPHTAAASSSPLALLVVEKECISHALLHGPLGSFLAERCLVLCARGYPCITTRHVMCRLHARWPDMPVLALVDGDPHGIAILLVMMGLSVADPARRGARQSTAAATPAARLPVTWIGLRPSTMATLTTPNTRSASGAPLTAADTALLSRLVRVVRTAMHACGMPRVEDGEGGAVMRCLESVLEEVSLLMRMRVKFELEAALRV